MTQVTIQHLLKNLAAAETPAEMTEANFAVANYVHDFGPGVVVNKDGTATVYTRAYIFGTPQVQVVNYPVWVIQ
jgi:hypothetical protein